MTKKLVMVTVDFDSWRGKVSKEIGIYDVSETEKLYRTKRSTLIFKRQEYKENKNKVVNNGDSFHFHPYIFDVVEEDEVSETEVRLVKSLLDAHIEYNSNEIERMQARLTAYQEFANRQNVDAALKVAEEWSQFDGSHHKAWAIDQMVRALTGDNYEEWVATYRKDETEEDEYEWDCGVAP